MKKIMTVAGCAILALSSMAVQAAGDAEAGKAKSVTCAACHGPDGNSPVPMYPKLAGQHADYLANAIKAYKGGQRTSPNAMMMAPMVQSLSDQDIDDLAAYFASQTQK